jgi:phage terminase Nu1 subunit (DNA packaging protein)
MKEKYEHEIRELENSEKGLKDKYIEARTRLAESEANNQNLKAMATQMELQLSHSTKVGFSRCVLIELHALLSPHVC